MAPKIALVTGASRGLGKDMALNLAKKGLDVILTYNTNKIEAEKVVSEIVQMKRKAVALQVDMANIKSLDSFIGQIASALKSNWNADKFDFLINNAGTGATIPISQVTEEAFDNLLNIHYKGVYFLTHKAIPIINDHGGVIFISSGTTVFVFLVILFILQ